MFDLEARIRRLEETIAEQRQTIRGLADRLARAETNIQAVRTTPGGGGGSSGTAFWCKSPGGGVAAATGTWPSLTAATFTADVYFDSAGTQTLYASGATIRWWYKDADPGNRLMPLTPNGDGTYDGIADSCTRVDI